jgi:dUTPase
MSIYFEKVSRFADIDLPLPQRSTLASAGYDFVVAEDIVLPPYDHVTTKIKDKLFENGRMKDDYFGFLKPLSLDEIAATTKELKVKIPLVSTGMKCHLEPG